jgi:hypothetical protein
MIPNPDQYDVYVSEGVLVEVWRGERISVAQQFGVEWDGPSHSVMHGAVFCREDAPPVPRPEPQRVARLTRAWRALYSHRCAWLWLGYVLGLLAGWWARGR